MCLAKSSVSKSGAVFLRAKSLLLISASVSGFVANSRARRSYCSAEVVASSGRPIAFKRLPATRAGNPCPSFVTTGTPIRSASLAVVWALKLKVSKNKSASRRRLRCSGDGILSANTRRSGSTPRDRDSLLRFCSAHLFPLNNHNTLPSTCCSRRIQTSNALGDIL